MGNIDQEVRGWSVFVWVVQYSQTDSNGVSGDKKGLHCGKAPYSNGSIGEYASH